MENSFGNSEDKVTPVSAPRKIPSFLAWLFIILPGLIARARFGGLGAFRGLAGAILTVLFTISLIRIAGSDSAIPERLPVGIAVLIALILLSLSIMFWGYRAFRRAAAAAPAGEDAEPAKDSNEEGRDHDGR